MPEPGNFLRAVVVDDEAPAREVLIELLRTMDTVEVVAQCANGFEAVKAVQELDPDLLLLDIQMPKLDGFEVLELLERDVAVVFVTAYDEHALRAFEVHAVDYLLKPFTADRLATAVMRAHERTTRAAATDLGRLAADARPRQGPLERVLVRDGDRVHVIPVDEIDLVEADDDGVLIHGGGQSHRKLQRLSDLAARLDEKRFVRVHRSFVLNIDRIARIELYAKDSRIAILTDGRTIPISRSGYARLRELL